MNKKSNQFFIVRYVAIISLAFITMMGSVKAQDFRTDRVAASKAYKAGEYEKSQALYNRIVQNYGSRAGMLYGPRFGLILYSKGMVELRLAGIAKRKNKLDEAAKWFEQAAESFRTCYEKYKTGTPGMAKTINLRHKLALERWAEACIGLEEYEKAIKLYKKFLKERNKNRDPILPSLGGFNINLAICHFLKPKPDIPAGIKYFETALSNKEKMKTSDGGIVAAFLALSKAVIAKKNEQAMVDFLNKNRADITLAPYQMAQFSPIFMKLAADALEAKMYVASFSLYALIPDSTLVLEDLNARISMLGGRKGIRDGNNILYLNELQSEKEKIEKRISEGRSTDAQALTAMAYLHDKAGNQRGVYGALEQLELYYNKCKKREDNLYNLVRVSSLIGEIFKTEEYGRRFIKAFPKSQYVEAVRQMMLSSLFFGGEYKKSLEVATVMRDKVAKGTPQHDLCLFVLGGSNFYLGNFEAAQPILDEHVKTYPKSKFIMHSEFFQASNLTRIQYWDRAAKLLDAFLKKYPDPGKNIYLPMALYDRANCHFANNEYADALKLLKRLENEFQTSPVTDMAYNMMGNIYESENKLDKAEEYYKKAIALAERRDHPLVAAEAISYMVGMLGVEKRDKKPNPRIKDAIPYYDMFMKKYASTPYKPEVVVFGMPAMKAAGRIKEGLKNLEVVIAELAKGKRQLFLENCVNAYSEAFLSIKGNTSEKLKEKYYDFPGIDLTNKRSLALLRINIIGVYEAERKKALAAKDDAKVSKLNAKIKVLFDDLKSSFVPKDLNNSVLLRIADYLKDKTSAPKQALPYYEELLSRKDKFGEFKARLGMADILGRSSNPSDQKKALVQLDEVYRRAKDDKATREKALYRIIEINDALGNWAAVEKRSREYLKAKLTKHSAMVGYLLAKSFDKRDMIEDALLNYSLVYSSNRGYLKVSCPAVKRVMEILWERDLPVGAKVGKRTLKIKDRQTAYSEIGYPFIHLTQRLRDGDKITDEDKALWDEVAALVKKYEKSGEVKTYEELQEEKRKNRRHR